jgi:hypothetical protein
MAYTKGTAANILVGAAAIFVGDPVTAKVPAPATGVAYVETLSTSVATTDPGYGWRNVGYTSNGLELQFAPEFGEVQVDQILDVAKLFKSGMTVTLNTSMAEATLENLAFAIATSVAVSTNDKVGDKDLAGTPTWGVGNKSLSLTAGELGDCPVEKKLIAVGAGLGDCSATQKQERIYTAYRVLSIESVTASQKRDENSTFDVSFRLLPDGLGRYGQIVDRTYTPS